MTYIKIVGLLLHVANAHVKCCFSEILGVTNIRGSKSCCLNILVGTWTFFAYQSNLRNGNLTSKDATTPHRVQTRRHRSRLMLQKTIK